MHTFYLAVMPRSRRLNPFVPNVLCFEVLLKLRFLPRTNERQREFRTIVRLHAPNWKWESLSYLFQKGDGVCTAVFIEDHTVAKPRCFVNCGVLIQLRNAIYQTLTRHELYVDLYAFSGYLGRFIRLCVICSLSLFLSTNPHGFHRSIQRTQAPFIVVSIRKHHMQTNEPETFVVAPDAPDQLQFFFRLLLRVPVWPMAAFIERFYRTVIFLSPAIDACSTDSIFPCGFRYLLPFDNLFDYPLTKEGFLSYRCHEGFPPF